MKRLSFYYIIRSPKKGWVVAKEWKGLELGDDATNSGSFLEGTVAVGYCRAFGSHVR